MPLARSRRMSVLAAAVAAAGVASPFLAPATARGDGGSACDLVTGLTVERPASDVDGDGTVGLDDVLAILSAWGASPAPWRLVSTSVTFDAEFANCECRCDVVTGTTATTVQGSWVLDGFCGIAEGFVDLAVGDDLLTFAGSGNTAVGCCGDAAAALAVVRLELELEAVASVPYQWTATLDECAVADVGRVRLAGPGLTLEGANQAAGTLVPGTWTVLAEGVSLADCSIGACGAEVAFTLDLGAPRDRRDVDGDGDVGLDDLLAVLAAWEV